MATTTHDQQASDLADTIARDLSRMDLELPEGVNGYGFTLELYDEAGEVIGTTAGPVERAASELLAALRRLVALHTDGSGPEEEAAWQQAVAALELAEDALA